MGESNLEADHNEEIFLRDCLILKRQMEEQQWPRSAEELLRMRDERLREKAAKVPEYER
jgi:hypothetical protein